MTGIEWFIVALLALIIIWMSEVKDPEPSFIGFCATGVALGILQYYKFIDVLPLWAWMKEDPVRTIGVVVAYIPAGIAYIFLRWYWFAQEKALEFAQNCVQYPHSYSADKVEAHVPKFSQHVNRLVRWGTMWPFSLLFNIFNHPLRRIFTMFLNKYGYILDNISKKAFKSAIKQ